MPPPGHERFIRRSFELARAAVAHGNHPFGALLVDASGRIVLEAENTVVTDRDPTGHAETNLVRAAGRELAAGVAAECTLYTSTEPCPMCAGAIFWSGVPRVVFGAAVESLADIVGASAPLLRLSCREVLARGARPIEVVGPVLEPEAKQVHQEFWSRP